MPEKKKEKRIPTAKDWDKIAVMYMRGESTEMIMKAFPDLILDGKKIYNKMYYNGVREKRNEVQKTVLEHLAKRTEEEKLAVNNRCIQLFNDGAIVIDSLLKQYISEVRNKQNIPKGAAKATAYNTNLLMEGITKIQKGLRVAYGMEDNNKLYEKEPEVLVIEGVDQDKI